MKSEIVASSLEIFGFSKQTETLLFYLKKLWNFFLDFFIFFLNKKKTEKTFLKDL